MPQRETEQSSWFVDEVLPHEAGLRRWIKSRFSAIRDVDDLIQETYSRILKIHESGPIPNPQAFLFVVSRNLAINKLRRMSLEYSPETESLDPLVLADEMAGPFESAVHQEEIDQLVAAIQSLPDRCRQVMTLKKIYGLTQKEVAAKMGVSENTVEAQIGIGMRKCTAFFKQRGYKTRKSR
jgi:RNA polymerase sigma factor (sigma-70 family)